jgi:hypothetical protein
MSEHRKERSEWCQLQKHTHAGDVTKFESLTERACISWWPSSAASAVPRASRRVAPGSCLFAQALLSAEKSAQADFPDLGNCFLTQSALWSSPSARVSTSADESHPLNSPALLATILNDVFTFGIGLAFLNLHCLFAYDAVQETYERAFIVVRMMSPATHVGFAFSPISTSVLNASERDVSFATAQASTCAISSAGIRAAICGSLPVAGRPRLFLGATFIDFFII